MITALLLALAILQDPKPAPTNDARLQLGGVEAPKQPELTSRATFTQSPRTEIPNAGWNVAWAATAMGSYCC